jgi:hypothetical protein
LEKLPLPAPNPFAWFRGILYISNDSSQCSTKLNAKSDHSQFLSSHFSFVKLCGFFFKLVSNAKYEAEFLVGGIAHDSSRISTASSIEIGIDHRTFFASFIN